MGNNTAKAMKQWMIIVVSMLFFSCGDTTETKEDDQALENIATLEDSIRLLSDNPNPDLDLIRLTRKSFIDALLDYYKAQPESKKSASFLDKASTTYAEMGDYYRSAQWADTLLLHFPEYSQRHVVLESQATAYDVFIQPRDSVKVRLYYSMLLNEFPELKKEKRAGIVKRLRYNDLSFDEYLEQEMQSNIPED